MEIKTKFDLWQEVWIILDTMSNERVSSNPHLISEIHVNKYRDDICISYKFSDFTGTVFEDYVFKSKKEAEIFCAELKQKRLSEQLAEVTTYLRELKGEE
jgi:hypothetical protein